MGYGVILPIDFHIFRVVGIPPTSYGFKIVFMDFYIMVFDGYNDGYLWL